MAPPRARLVRRTSFISRLKAYLNPWDFLLLGFRGTERERLGRFLPAMGNAHRDPFQCGLHGCQSKLIRHKKRQRR